jgi:hypothetical protein
VTTGNGAAVPDFSALAKHAHATVGGLQLLIEHMEIAGWRTDEFSREDLALVADSLRGMALRAAMHAGDAETLSAISGRQVREIKPFEDFGEENGKDPQ